MIGVDRPEFQEYVLAQVAKACERRCDGYGLRGEEGPVRNFAPRADDE